MPHNLFDSLKQLTLPDNTTLQYYALPALEKAGLGNISRLPVSIRIVLESVLRNYDDKKIKQVHVEQLAAWQPHAPRTHEIPFVVARIVLQDFTGVPLLVDLAAMRSAAKRLGKNPEAIEPMVPVDLVVDHSVQIDHYGDKDALRRNMEIEFQRNHERYQFIKWGMQAFDTFRVVPPGIGIVHQINLEYLACGVHQKNGLIYPDTLVGTDSHTTMINSIGVVGWGVGGIEAEAGMLNQPVYFLTPDVVGVHLTGHLQEGLTATDLVLTITQMLRKANVVGKFVEFFGEGAASLSLPDRATIANMAPEYGATMGFFPVDDMTLQYFRQTGRTEAEIDAFKHYFEIQQLFGMPRFGEIDYSQELSFDLGSVEPSLAGPRRPQDRITLKDLKSVFSELFVKPVSENGYGKSAELLQRTYLTRDDQQSTETLCPTPYTNQNGYNLPCGSERNVVEMANDRPTEERVEADHVSPRGKIELHHGDILIAAITSCTNTSNPAVLIAAGLLAKKAVEKGLTVKQHIKTSLAPGSRVVTDYLTAAGLMPYLEQLGFNLAGYGCTTCIGNSGPLLETIEETVVKEDLICAAVLSGNRNFEARIHANIRANFLASPPLVVAYAIAGTVLKDLTREPLVIGKNGQPVWLRDIWPTSAEIAEMMHHATQAETFRRLYSDFTKDLPLWNEITAATGKLYDWPKSTYIAEPPFFEKFLLQIDSTTRHDAIREARALAIFGDSVTTDHISPAGAIKESSPAGRYLLEHGVRREDFNSYGARRGNHHVMMRGTFANIRIKNLMVPGKEGGVTIYRGEGADNGRQMSIFDAAMQYLAHDIPTLVFAGKEYGTGSSRDWAAKGTQLLGVGAVIAESYERIHRSNLVGMGVLPLQFMEDDSVQSLGLTGDEHFDLLGLDDLQPQKTIILVIRKPDQPRQEVSLRCRIDTDIEVDYYYHGGILPYVLRNL
ncbi:aconitate hydratase [Nitrosomonas mobilis]|uniref:Aconitate hydratase A n=1 Tax=Nitrosomonas mobilis TaxID=51642 RepID=A0A1G5SGR4_9PROT|nr:aconitate hydratase [Nitrosomonas mobilis]SCZ86302.1 aconitate hydratase 1 [Nitrosomonas mobilis]